MQGKFLELVYFCMSKYFDFKVGEVFAKAMAAWQEKVAGEDFPGSFSNPVPRYK